MTKKTVLAGVAASAIMLAAAPIAQQQQEQDPASRSRREFQPAEQERISLTFAGGTAYDYLQVVRKASPAANIVIDELSKHVPMGPAELTETTVEAAVMLVEGMQGSIEGAPVMLDADFINAQPPARPIFRVRAEMAGPRQTIRQSSGAPAVMSHVWSVAELTAAGVEADDILSAVETALSLEEDAGEPKIRYHEPTALLIARAHPRQVETIDRVIGELHGTAAAKKREAAQPAQSELEMRYTGMERALQQLVQRVRALEEKLDGQTP